MKIVVILPTYNEKANMEKMIPVLEDEVFPKIKHHHMQILVADDKSPDGTAEVVRVFQKKYHNLHLIEGHKEGLGAAYVRAMQHAMNTLGADAVMEIDSDFQHDPHDIPRLIKAMDDGADYVIGSRYIPGGEIPKEWGLHRKLISRFGGQFAQLLMWRRDVHDMTSGFKLTKTSYLKRVDLDHLYSKYYAYKLHILHDVLKLGAKVVEVPTIFYERKEGSSKITQKDLFDSFWVVIKLRAMDSKRVIKFLVVGGTGFLVQLMSIYFFITLGMPQVMATMFGGEAAILCNFYLNNLWTFKDTKDVSKRGNVYQRLLKFNTASLFSIAVQTVVVAIAVGIHGEYVHLFGYQVHTSLAVVIPTIIFLVIPLNYFIYNKLIWKTHHLKNKTVVEA
jgi:dolichol-phosphate mannosyltransferase